jgi:hypothetical protein
MLDEMGDSVRPLTMKQIEWIRKDTAKFIWFEDKDYYHGYCDRCEHDVEFKEKTRHNATVKCPRCKMEMKIRHRWRGYTEDVDFRVIVSVKDKKALFRYVLVKQINRDRKYGEVARQIDDYEYMRTFYYYHEDGCWKEGNKHQYFTEFGMQYAQRRYFCMYAKAYKPGLNAELKKFEWFKYIDNPATFVSNGYCVSTSMDELKKHADFYEKLEKVGLSKFGADEFRYWCGRIWIGRKQYSLINDKATSLVDMLKLNKGSYKRFKDYRTLTALEFLQSYPNIKEDILRYANDNKVNVSDYNTILEMKIGHEFKALRYITENKINSREYEHYVFLLKELGYELDKAYLFPKDFRKEDDRLTKEYNERQKEIEQNKKAKQNSLIKQISDGLRNMKDLQEFINGSRGLLVYVPESAEELMAEGNKLHNCLSSYAPRIAEGKTLIFFVRRLNAPNDPFVAFEYCNGEVVQCKYDYNKEVEDKKIINFVDALAERLRKNNVLYKAA